MELSDYDRLQRERDNWKASAISAIERAEMAEAEVERLTKRNTYLAHDMCLAQSQADDRLNDWQDVKLERDKAREDVERIQKAAEIACKHWRKKSNLLSAAMDALCDHVGIDPC